MIYSDKKSVFVGFIALCLMMTMLLSGSPRLVCAFDDFDFGDDDFGDDFGTDFGTPTTTAPATTPRFDSGSFGESDYMVDNPVRYFNDDPATDDRRYKDPFKPLIVREVAAPAVPTVRPETGPAPRPEVIPPLNLTLVGVVESGDRSLAMIMLDNEMHMMFEGDTVPDKFRVVKVDPDSVTVFDHRTKSRRMLRLGGGD